MDCAALESGTLEESWCQAQQRAQSEFKDIPKDAPVGSSWSPKARPGIVEEKAIQGGNRLVRRQWHVGGQAFGLGLGSDTSYLPSPGLIFLIHIMGDKKPRREGRGPHGKELLWQLQKGQKQADPGA